MPRKKKVSVEIMPKTSRADIQAMLDRMVKERVDEIMAELGAEVLVPGYQPRDVSNEMRVHQNVFERKKWSLYFEKHGCQKCDRKKNISHASGGLLLDLV
jgi:hypothetical protein